MTARWLSLVLACGCQGEPLAAAVEASDGAAAVAVDRVAAGVPARYGNVEILRDDWGIPHVFSDTDEGAMFGLGYATAEERGFQMSYGRRIMQGRLAETIGARPHGSRRETALDLDRKMRTFGWRNAAARVTARLDRGTLALLRAYAEGVNASFARQRVEARLHPLFAELEMEIEPWEPADCLLSWWHVAQFFATDGTRDLISWRNETQAVEGRRPPQPGPGWVDDATAVVQRGDVTDAWAEAVERFAASLGVAEEGEETGVEGPKFSHAWVVSGAKAGTGAAVLVSDPQTPVRNPSLWMEFHVSGRTFNARGVGVPGSPGLLIGFNRRVADRKSVV